MHPPSRSLWVCAGVLTMTWLAGGLGCDPEPTGDSTAAANAVSVGTAAGGQGGSGASTGTAGAGGVGGGAGGSGGGGDTVNGCTLESALDRTGQANVLINSISPWDFNHQACVIVDAGTTVRWEAASFGLHPLIGGVAPTPDAASPISDNTVVEDGATDFVEITLDTAGDYPYFCQNHPTNMLGVIYVQGGS